MQHAEFFFCVFLRKTTRIGEIAICTKLSFAEMFVFKYDLLAVLMYNACESKTVLVHVT